MKQRIIEMEALDHAPPELARPNLADLVRINRHFGGHSVLRRLFAQVSPPGDSPFTVLDVGAASGDSARFIRSIYPEASVVSLDLHPVNLAAAPHPKVIGDAFHLPIADRSVDYVMSSLFLHHFTDDEVVTLLREFQRAARKAVLIADLERSILPYLFIGYSHVIFGWGDITVADGKKSVRAAFRRSELEQVAKQAGLSEIRVTVHRPAFRLTLVASTPERTAGE